MKRYFFHIAYNGANHSGWQRQKNAVTVQEVIENKLEQVFKYKIPCLGCGRTDAGVHASQYIFHIDVQEEIHTNLKLLLNKALPKDISVFDILLMNGEPHAQFSAKERTYDYFIHTIKDPFLADISALYVYESLDLNEIKKAISVITNYTDFRAFCKTPDKHNNTICHVKSVRLFCNSDADKIRMQFTADRFLKSMIRIIVHKLLEIGAGKLSVEKFEYYLKHKETPRFNQLAYPQGLYLSKVTYPFLDLEPKSESNYIFQNDLKSYWKEI